MKELKISESKALELYPTAPPELKEMLISAFGEDHFKEREWQKVTGYEAACKLDGVDPVEYLPYKNPQDQEEEVTNSFKRMLKCQKMINKLDGNYKANYDKNSPKVKIWVDMRNGGVGFSRTLVGYSITYAYVGSRFDFASHDTAKHFYNICQEDINIFQTYLNTL